MRSLALGTTALVAVCVAALAVVGGGAPRATGAAPRTLKVTERDFRIVAPKHVRAGAVTLRVHNEGPDSHELIVVRTRGGELPLRRDAVSVDEDALEHDTMGTLEPGEPRVTRELELHLAAGRYDLICNMSGHYMGGMRAVLVVA
jgi:uncharacterized cupredoxin-like copper-binding protein